MQRYSLCGLEPLPFEPTETMFHRIGLPGREAMLTDPDFLARIEHIRDALGLPCLVERKDGAA